MTATTTIKEASATLTMYVSAIEMDSITRKAGRNYFTKALATITILDADGDPVVGVTVNGTWTGATSDIDSGITNTDGQVILASDEEKNADETTFTFTVDTVTVDGEVYNIGTSGSITVP